jgi:hypothetical protein
MERPMKRTVSVILLFIMVSSLIFVSVSNLGRSLQNGGVTGVYPGIISSDQTWTKENSPYNVTGDFTVAKGATLTIEPAVIVELNGYTLR